LLRETNKSEPKRTSGKKTRSSTMAFTMETIISVATDEDETESIGSLNSSRSQSEKVVPDPMSSPLTDDSIYEFYADHLLPTILSSLPILARRLCRDAFIGTASKGQELCLSVQPEWMKGKLDGLGDALLLGGSAFNADGDAIESQQTMRSFQAFFVQWIQWLQWLLVDWNILVFLWQNFGGIILVVAVLSVMPGRIHTLLGKFLRLPLMGLIYLVITIELFIYIAVRLVIRTLEVCVATPKHRELRSKMANASNSYKEWYGCAAELDRSQKRNLWQNTTRDETSVHYNWPLIDQLLAHMREARLVKKDPMLALAVLQQCTRKNVGGIMDEDLFCQTHTGEPKFIVMEFMDEVAKIVHWLTDHTLLMEQQASESQRKHLRKRKSLREYRRFQEKSRLERKKLWKSLVEFSTLDFFATGGVGDNKPIDGDGGDSTATSAIPDYGGVAFDDVTASSSRSSSEQSSCGSRVGREQLAGFLKRAHHAYGKTALCLSGGAMMGMYHIGHLKGLIETDCMPEIVSGTSAGSVIGAVLCTRTDDELLRDLEPEVIGPQLHPFDRNWRERIWSLVTTGNMFCGEHWQDVIQWFTRGDMTFEEAYRKTGRIFCVTLSAVAKKTSPVLMNYISAPNVTIRSAVVASAAVPGLIAPQTLMIKDPDGTIRSAGPELYVDGSIRHDIPIVGLSEMLNCRFFVACQCNPHVLPFFFNVKGGVGEPSRWIGDEHETSWRGGFLLAALEMYLKNDMQSKFLFLQNLDSAIGFTGTMFTQSFIGTTTIVPPVQLRDFALVMTDPSVPRLRRYMRVGSIAAYQHTAMIRCHYRVYDALEECIAKLERGGTGGCTTEPNEFVVRLDASHKKKVGLMARSEAARISRRSTGGEGIESGSLSSVSETDLMNL